MELCTHENCYNLATMFSVALATWTAWHTIMCVDFIMADIYTYIQYLAVVTCHVLNCYIALFLHIKFCS